MINKLTKHLSLLKRQLTHKQEIARLKKYPNPLLQTVVEAIEKAKSDSFSAAEQAQFAELEKYRGRLFQDDTEITYEVFNSDAKSRVSDISRIATSPPVWCKLHYSIAKQTGAKQYLEIGTNLGISGSYLLTALKSTGGHFITMEGLPALCRISGARFAEIASPDKFEVMEGLYDKTFPELLTRNLKFDTIFIDGNHKKKPTLEYFNLLRKSTTDKAVFVFDDINWNQEMKETWAIIKQDPAVNFSLDLFKLGIVIIDKSESQRNVSADLFYAY